MNNESSHPDTENHVNPETGTSSPPESSETSDSGCNRRDPFKDFGNSLRDALETGGRDARRAFEEALPKAKEDLAKGIHDVAYAIAYASAFGGALIREITPANLKDGLREGTEAGEKAAGEVLRQRRERAERESRSGFPGGETSPTG